MNPNSTELQHAHFDALRVRRVVERVFRRYTGSSVSNVQRVMERTGVEICDVEALFPHYDIYQGNR